jgi:hypothetical protein
MKRRPQADWLWREGPNVVAADFKRTKPALASLLVARQLASFEVQPLGVMVISLGSGKPEQFGSMLAKGVPDLIRGVHASSIPTHNPIAKKIISAPFLNELSESIVEALGMINALETLGSDNIVLATAQTHQSLLSLGHHRPAVYLSQVLDTPIATIHYRVDLARRRDVL